MPKNLTFEHVVKTVLCNRRVWTGCGAAASNRTEERFLDDLKCEFCPWPAKARASFVSDMDGRKRITVEERHAMTAVHLLTRADLWKRGEFGKNEPPKRDYRRAGSDDTRDAWHALLVTCTPAERDLFAAVGRLLERYPPEAIAKHLLGLDAKARERAVFVHHPPDTEESERQAIFRATIDAKGLDRWVDEAAAFEFSYNNPLPDGPPPGATDTPAPGVSPGPETPW